MAHHGVSYRRLYYGLDTNTLPLLVGCLAGFLYTSGYCKKISQRLSALIPFVTMVAIALFLYSVPEQSEWAYEGPIQWSVCSTAATLVAILLNPNSWMARILAHPGLVFLGLISYSLYLWNPFAMLIARNLGSLGRSAGPSICVVGVIFTFDSGSRPTTWWNGPASALKDRFEVYRGGTRAPSLTKSSRS